MRSRAVRVSLQLAAMLVTCVPAWAQTDLVALSGVKHELKGGQTDTFRISLTAGQFLHAVVEQQDLDLVTAVFGPDGKQLTESDSPNDRWGSEPIIFVASTSGEHRIEIRSPYNTAPVGSYQIKITALREATEIDKGHAAAQLIFDEGRKLRVQQAAPAKRAAIEKYQQALPLFKAAGDTYREALTLLSTGIAYVPLNESRTALGFFNEARALAVSLGDQRLEAGTETYIGGMLDILGDVGKALEHQHQALKLARAGGWRLSEGNALSNIGKIYNDVADWQKALEFYGQALPIFKELGRQQNEAITLNNIGIAYYYSGENQKALDYLQQSLPLLQAVGNKNSEAYTLVNIARVYYRLADYQKALAHLNLAQAIQKVTGNRAQEGETIDEIGAAYSALGQLEKAVAYHREGLEILRSAGNVRREALALLNLGETYNLLDQPEKALEQFNQALTILRNIGDLNATASALDGIARAERKRGNFEESRKNITESLALIETVRSRSGSLQLRASYRASVEKAYEFYVDLLMQQHAKNPSQGFDADALKASERGRARSLLEKLSEAPIDIREGIDPKLLEKERDLKLVLNAKAQRELQLKARKGSAQEIATLQKEISALEDQFQQVQSEIRKSSPRYSALTQPQPLGLKEIQQQLDPETALLEYNLGAERSYLWVVTTDALKSYELPKRAEIEKIARQLSESLGARSTVKSLETPAQRKARIAEGDRKFQEAADELSRMILVPAVEGLGKKRLVIVSDGALQYVPFAALPAPRPVTVSDDRQFVPKTTVAFTNKRPIILDHEIISLQSASAFALQRQNLSNREPAPRSVAVIADPVFSTKDQRLKAGAATSDTNGTRILEHLEGSVGNGLLSIPRLPYTRQEADQILAVAPRNSSIKVLDFRASRTTAMSEELSKYRYVHFATHGYLDKTRADLSAIVLSMVDQQGKPLDGFLRAHDIYNLKLPAELVVLSACETGLGKDVTGEGLEGLTRGFMYAGARRVVVSLWNVNDKATAALMQRMYNGMLREDKTPAAALRAAQIEMLRTKQWESPYYWAAFVMQGEWR